MPREAAARAAPLSASAGDDARSGVTESHRPSGVAGPTTVADFYDAHLSFVWRNARRLLGSDGVDDIVQQVFLVAVRKFPEFEHRSSPRTWLYGILRRVAADHRRANRRRGIRDSTDMDEMAARDSGPLRKAERSEARHRLYELLGALDEAKRDVFIMIELEQMSAPEVAGELGVPLTTVYARLRDARREFETAVKRLRARDEGRQA
jgi:RNA polymerase sigma-70 factor (ECF subfamily)